MKKAAILVVGAMFALAVVTAGTAGVQALITSAQIKDGTIASRDIKNGSIGRADISANALSSLRGPRGLAGAAGAQGPAGTQGAQGPAGAQGSQGEKGPQGEKGEKGDAGATGRPGREGRSRSRRARDRLGRHCGRPPGDRRGGRCLHRIDTGHLHVFDGTAFVDTGLVQGPKAPGRRATATGCQGVQRRSSPATAVPIAAPSGRPIRRHGGARCPSGKVAVGGGVTSAIRPARSSSRESYPAGGRFRLGRSRSSTTAAIEQHDAVRDLRDAGLTAGGGQATGGRAHARPPRRSAVRRAGGVGIR